MQAVMTLYGVKARVAARIIESFGKDEKIAFDSESGRLAVNGTSVETAATILHMATMDPEG